MLGKDIIGKNENMIGKKLSVRLSVILLKRYPSIIISYEKTIDKKTVGKQIYF